MGQVLEFFSRFSIEIFDKVILIKLLISFFLALRNNPTLFRRGLFSTGILPLFIPLNLLTYLLCSLIISNYFQPRIQNDSSITALKPILVE